MKINNIPDKIYLQVGPFENSKKGDEIDINTIECSWCKDREFSTDIAYLSKQGLKDCLEQMKTQEEHSNKEDRTGSVRAINNVLNLIRLL